MSKRKNPIVAGYKVRWGNDRRRVLKGHPKREARKDRAYARGGSLPGAVPNPPGSKAKRRAAMLAAAE